MSKYVSPTTKKDKHFCTKRLSVTLYMLPFRTKSISLDNLGRLDMKDVTTMMKLVGTDVKNPIKNVLLRILQWTTLTFMSNN